LIIESKGSNPIVPGGAHFSDFQRRLIRDHQAGIVPVAGGT
jgi:hypothetical protein